MLITSCSPLLAPSSRAFSTAASASSLQEKEWRNERVQDRGFAVNYSGAWAGTDIEGALAQSLPLSYWTRYLEGMGGGADRVRGRFRTRDERRGVCTGSRGGERERGGGPVGVHEDEACARREMPRPSPPASRTMESHWGRVGTEDV